MGTFYIDNLIPKFNTDEIFDKWHFNELFKNSVINPLISKDKLRGNATILKENLKDEQVIKLINLLEISSEITSDFVEMTLEVVVTTEKDKFKKSFMTINIVNEKSDSKTNLVTKTTNTMTYSQEIIKKYVELINKSTFNYGKPNEFLPGLGG